MGLFNHSQHNDDEDNVPETNKIRNYVGKSKVVQNVENEIINGKTNKALQILELFSKPIKTFNQIIEVIKIMVDHVAPKADESFRNETNSHRFNSSLENN